MFIAAHGLADIAVAAIGGGVIGGVAAAGACVVLVAAEAAGAAAVTAAADVAAATNVGGGGRFSGRPGLRLQSGGTAVQVDKTCPNILAMDTVGLS